MLLYGGSPMRLSWRFAVSFEGKAIHQSLRFRRIGELADADVREKFVRFTHGGECTNKRAPGVAGEKQLRGVEAPQEERSQLARITH